VTGQFKESKCYSALVSGFGFKFIQNIEQPARIDRLAEHPAVKGLEYFYTIDGICVDGGEALAWYGNAPVLVLKQFGEGKVILAGLGWGFMGPCLNHSGRVEEAEKNIVLLKKLVGYLLST